MRVYLAYFFHDYYFFFFVSSLCFSLHDLYHFLPFSSFLSYFLTIDQIIYSCHELNFGNVCSLTVIRYEEMTSLVFFFLMEPQFFLASLINVSLIFELMAINSWYLYFRSDIVSKSFCSVNCIKLVHHVLFFFQRMNSLYHMSCELYL